MAIETERDRARKIANGATMESKHPGITKKARNAAVRAQPDFGKAVNSGPSLGNFKQKQQGGAGGADGVAASDASGTGAQTPSLGQSFSKSGQHISEGLREGGQLFDSAFKKSADTIVGTARQIPSVLGGFADRAKELYQSANFTPSFDGGEAAPAASPTGPVVPAPSRLGSTGVYSERPGDRPGGGGAILDDIRTTTGDIGDVPRSVGGFDVTEGENGDVLYEDGSGNFLSGTRPGAGSGVGLGTLSNVGGPGGNDPASLETEAGRQAGIARNVAAYDRQTNAIRQLREAQSDFNPNFGNTGESIRTGDSEYERELAARNARVGGNRYEGGDPRKVAAQVKKDALAFDIAESARADDTRRRGQDIAFDTASANRAADVQSDRIAAQRKLGEDNQDVALRAKRLELDTNKARADANMRSRNLDENTQKRYNTAVNNAVGTFEKTGDAALAFRQVLQGADAITAKSLFPEEYDNYLQSLSEQGQQ